MDERQQGLLLCGTITGRTRRQTGQKRQHTLVTYRLQGGGSDYYLDDWNPSQYYAVGDSICLPVTPRIYQRNGLPQLHFISTANPPPLHGETF